MHSLPYRYRYRLGMALPRAGQRGRSCSELLDRLPLASRSEPIDWRVSRRFRDLQRSWTLSELPLPAISPYHFGSVDASTPLLKSVESGIFHPLACPPFPTNLLHILLSPSRCLTRQTWLRRGRADTATNRL